VGLMEWCILGRWTGSRMLNFGASYHYIG